MIAVAGLAATTMRLSNLAFRIGRSALLAMTVVFVFTASREPKAGADLAPSAFTPKVRSAVRDVAQRDLWKWLDSIPPAQLEAYGFARSDDLKAVTLDPPIPYFLPPNLAPPAEPDALQSVLFSGEIVWYVPIRFESRVPCLLQVRFEGGGSPRVAGVGYSFKAERLAAARGLARSLGSDGPDAVVELRSPPLEFALLTATSGIKTWIELGGAAAPNPRVLAPEAILTEVQAHWKAAQASDDPLGSDKSQTPSLPGSP